MDFVPFKTVLLTEKLIIGALLVWALPSFALSPLPESLGSMDSWNKDQLGKLYESATAPAQIQDFEEYKAWFGGNPYYSGEPPLVHNLLDFTTEGDDFLYSDVCALYGASDSRSIGKPWDRLTSGRIFRSERQQIQQIINEIRANHFLYDGPPARSVLFSGGWTPSPVQLVETLAPLFSVRRTARDLVLEVKRNDDGIYSDFAAPVSIYFRKTKGILVGKFEADGDLAGYKVCYRRSVHYCYAHAKVRGTESDESGHNLVTKDTAFNDLFVAATDKEAREALKDTVLGFCGYRDENKEDGQCQAAKQAAASVVCDSSIANLKIMRLRHEYDANSGKLYWRPLTNELFRNY